MPWTCSTSPTTSNPAPREEARAEGLAAFHPEGELPEDYRERFALDHDHPVHLEKRGYSPFAIGDPAEQTGASVSYREHPTLPATSYTAAGESTPRQSPHDQGACV